MIIVMNKNIEDTQVASVVEKLKEYGVDVHISEGVNNIIIGIIGDKTKVDREEILAFDGVEKVVEISDKYKLVNRKFHAKDHEITISNDHKSITIGGDSIILAVGPKKVISKEQLDNLGKFLSQRNIDVLRVGPVDWSTEYYNSNSLPYETMLEYAKEVCDKYNLFLLAEVPEIGSIEMINKYVDIVQVGARNMYHYRLLSKLGQLRKPILLRRGHAAYLEELLISAEYIAKEGNLDIILCERGIRTFEKETSYTFDISALAILKEKSHLPLCADPSHALNKKSLVCPVAKASVVAGANMLMLDVTDNTTLKSLPYSLSFSEFDGLLESLQKLGDVIGKKI